jgi:DNA-binding NarL/FixJ family response regulator
VLDLLAEGLQHWQIGERLGVATSTVKTHTTRIYEAFGAHNAPHAVHLAHRAGILTGDQS